MGMVKDLYRDGWGLVGLTAPIVSIAASILKLLDADMQWLKELSWGWVFAPIAAWLFIAYVRRWRFSQANLDPEPNWSMKEAFHYFVSDSKWALKRDPRVGNIYIDGEGELRDKATHGRIVVWARPIQQMKGGFIETDHQITKDEWDNLNFDLVSLVADTFESVHLVNLNEDDSDKYEYVRVNRAQFLGIWPKASFIQRQCDEYRQIRLDYFENEKTICGSG